MVLYDIYGEYLCPLTTSFAPLILYHGNLLLVTKFAPLIFFYPLKNRKGGRKYYPLLASTRSIFISHPITCTFI